MLAALLVLLPILAIMILQGDKIRKLERQLYEKEQENKKLRMMLGDPFRSQVAGEIAFGREDEDGDEPAKFAVMMDGLMEENEE